MGGCISKATEAATPMPLLSAVSLPEVAEAAAAGVVQTSIVESSMSGGSAAKPDSAPTSRPRDTYSASKLITRNPRSPHEVYIMERRILGQGTFGRVSRGTHRITGKTRAIKIVAKIDARHVAKFRCEIDIMRQLDHPNIVRLFETFEDETHFYLAMELCRGGDLLKIAVKAGGITEHCAAVATLQLLRAVRYMHLKNVAHRDLKPENSVLIMKGDLDQNVLKLIDFGLSRTFQPGQAMTSLVGSTYYISPQVLARRYDHLCDMWSLGVVVYILLCGYPPFRGRSDREVFAKVRTGVLAFSPRDWLHVSSDARQFVRELLRVDPSTRLDAQRALGHRWVLETAPRTSSAALASTPALLENLRDFRLQHPLKQAALQIIARQLGDGRLRDLREAFTALDADGDGCLTPVELTAGLDRAGFAPADDLTQIHAGVDIDGSGMVDYTEFMAAALDRQMYLSSEQACYTAFKVFDRDGDGRISSEELRALLFDDGGAEARNFDRATEWLREVDRDGDGMVDYEDFMAMLRGRPGVLGLGSPRAAAGGA